MSIISYDTLNNLQEISFIAGSSKLLTFECYMQDGINPLNISNGYAKWVLCPYGEYDVSILEKEGILITANSFTVQLNSTDSLSLSGKYIQQITVMDSAGNIFKPGQGVVIVLPGIPVS